MGIVGYVVLLLGIVFILVAATTYRRKGEAEISESLVEVPLFRAGVAFVIVGLVLKLIFH